MLCFIVAATLFTISNTTSAEKQLLKENVEALANGFLPGEIYEEGGENIPKWNIFETTSGVNCSSGGTKCCYPDGKCP